MLAKAIASWFARRTPRQILLAALVFFLLYAWPGFVGWDTRSHLLEARALHFSDGHPPAVGWLTRIVEVFIRGPAGLLLIQAVTLLGGLYRTFATRLSPRASAWCAAAIFIFPPIAGVQALIAKDGLMAGFLLLGIADLADNSAPRRRWWGLAWIFLASLMRWNALAATFAPVVLLFRWPRVAGVKRYAIALAAWFAITVGAYELNQGLADEHEYIWYWSGAYQDIAGTLHYADHIDEAELREQLEGVPLLEHDNLQEQFSRLYSPHGFYGLMRDRGRILRPAENQAEREAIYRAWKRIVYGHLAAFLRSRLETFSLLIQLQRPPTFTNVYVWFAVIGAPETVTELEHDAAGSRLQSILIPASMKISLTPIYYVFIYFALCFLLLPFAFRSPLVAATLLSAVGYQLAWFFLAASTDYRYSQWMIICSLVALLLVIASRRTAR